MTCYICANGNVSLAKAFVLRGASVGVVDSTSGYTALHKAAANGMLEMVRYLLSLDPPVDVNAVCRAGSTALHCAGSCSTGFAGDVIKEIVSHPAFVREMHIGPGRSPLLMCALMNAVDAVKPLVQFGAVDVNAQDQDGNTALHYAVNNESAPMIRVLLRLGARRDLRSRLFGTSVEQAKANNVSASIMALLSAP
jgi:ankyrin repeat protein